MDNKKDDKYYLERIINDLGFVIEHTKKLNKKKISNNPILLDSIMFRIIQVAENIDKLTEEFKDKYSNISWRAIKGMRNRIVHDYAEIDLTVVYDTVFSSIPDFYKLLKNIKFN